LVNNVDNPLRDAIYVGLPDARLLAGFPGFEQVDSATLPDVQSFILG
jgi:hypothetical protein